MLTIPRVWKLTRAGGIDSNPTTILQRAAAFDSRAIGGVDFIVVIDDRHGRVSSSQVDFKVRRSRSITFPALPLEASEWIRWPPGRVISSRRL